MSPRKMKGMLKSMGIDIDELENVSEVVIRMPDKEIVIVNPSVAVMDSHGVRSYQISGDVTERSVSLEEPVLDIPDSDVELVAAQTAASELNELPVSTDNLRAAAVKLVGKAVLKLASEKPTELEQLGSLTRLLLESEDNDIRRSRLKLAERYVDYEAAAAASKEWPRLRAYLAVIGDNTSLSHDEKIERVHAILYGWDRARTGGDEPDKSRNGH